ncbi:MAG: DoxX family membrane protein [Cytophagales bacterium]|nr:MAG: DoxX family membrane protein [Cytophagales bacterium]
MKTVVLVSRMLLGVIFFVFGLNAFFPFIPVPPLQGMAGNFVGALVQSGYFFPFLKTLETVGGLLLILGLFMPMVLVVLFPITLNIMLFHLFLGLEGMPIAILMLLAHLMLLYAHKNYYKGLFVMKTSV